MTAQRQHKFTYLMPEIDKFSFGEAYYHTIKDNAPEVSKRALKVILLVYAIMKKQSYPFVLKRIPYLRYFSYDMFLKGIKELVYSGYLDKPTRQTYKLNDKGTQFVKSFWLRHSRLFAKYIQPSVSVSV